MPVLAPPDVRFERMQSPIGQRQFDGSLEGTCELRLTLPSLSVAMRLADRGYAIGERAGVQLVVECRSPPVLLLRGTPVGNAVACYLVQKAIYVDTALQRL